MNTMTYRGYTASVEFDERDDIFIGSIFGTRDMITFHADTVAGLKREFRSSVDDYLAYCEEKGISPDKPASGKIMLRVSPEIHAASLIAAKAAGISLNQWAAQVLRAAATV
ncbi:MAG: type II toxin-antitoxin system HicB family antitoxin [Betaproteobacteria bacterium]|nr:type II toxin-antitoxin system HicB family antitoxin [Betaproteobacteria bacterium]